MKRLVFVVAPLALTLACGSGGGPASDTPPGDDSGDPSGFNLTGFWAARLVNSQIYEGSLGTDTVVATGVARVQIQHTGETATATTHICSMELTPYEGNQTIYPEAAVAAIEDLTARASISAQKVGATFVTDRAVSLLGWEATNDPFTDTLPTDEDDTRVYDADKDGEVGVTIEVDGFISGSVYVVGRSILQLTGTVEDMNHISGTSRSEQEQAVLGASSSLLELGDVTATPDPNESASPFEMVRLAAGATSCEDIRDALDAGT